MSRSFDLTRYHRKRKAYKECKRQANRRVRRLIEIGIRLGLDLVPEGNAYKRLFPLWEHREGWGPKSPRAYRVFFKLPRYKWFSK